MIPRHALSITLVVVIAATLVLSAGHGFGDAWTSQYTYAGTPVADSSALSPALESDVLPGSLASEAGDTPAEAAGSVPAAGEPPALQEPRAQALSRRVAEYHIEVRLSETEHLLSGKQTITWTNPGKQAVSELYFHLYPNAFASPQSTFMQESGGKLRSDEATADSTGYMKLESLQTGQGVNLLPRLHFVQPDDGNTADMTLAKLRLPDPVYPGDEVTLSMTYEVKLPEVFARMGYAGDFVMAGQWFPKLAKYETAGTRGRVSEGWNAHQYHGNSEFYSDFGIYSVKIDVPADYVVAATGFPAQTPVREGERKTYQFYADDVHDFAWSASPHFVYSETPFSAEGVPGVRIKLYLDPRHAKLKDRYLHAAQSALAKYAQWYGEYPYSTLSIVVPPAGAGGAGGMEYPTLVTGFAADEDDPGYELERVVVHEIGHQYWYGMVASNEFEEAWLDEGFTSYAEDKVMESEYGVAPSLRVEASYMTDPAPLKQLSWSYRSHDHYAENVYLRAKLVLVGIERRIGPSMMRKVMRSYFQQYKFNHPSTADFQRVVERVTGEDWDDFFSQYVYGEQMADFAVESIHVRPVRRNGLTVYESIVLIRKYGGDHDPVPIEFRFRDGTALSKEWDGKQSHIQYKLTHSAPLEWAVVDPNHTIVLDNRRINNFMKAELPRQTTVRWNLGIVKIIEGLLGSVGW
ncbi:M1 family metallopeptidase [Paenibacillus sp. IB182496]|uniref:M1 family metallopeptidase n=1 Tax=Paenibacillus sabuli TaxID=2772509 RepID=A0A927BTP8_9BACL|nr:M1 family metallopeptidase [Paenibacillus sabuli]MBD2845585.1 M1 family metallopeptidase [Paenibacillus sabuli]